RRDRGRREDQAEIALRQRPQLAFHLDPHSPKLSINRNRKFAFPLAAIATGDEAVDAERERPGASSIEAPRGRGLSGTARPGRRDRARGRRGLELDLYADARASAAAGVDRVS